MWFVVLYFPVVVKKYFTEFQTHVAGREDVGGQASQVFRAGVRRNSAVGRRSGTGLGVSRLSGTRAKAKVAPPRPRPRPPLTAGTSDQRKWEVMAL